MPDLSVTVAPTLLNVSVSPQVNLLETLVSGAGGSGSNGISPTLSVASTVATVPSGTAGSASINNSDPTHPVLSLTLPVGATGAAGTNGSNGSNGISPTLSVASTVATVPSGTAGSASLNNADPTHPILSLTLPVGATGATGANGTNGSAGAAASVTVGTTTTGTPGSSASVTNSGTTSAAILNFTLPGSAGLSTLTPSALAASGSVGTSTLAARADHVHAAPPASLISGLGGLATLNDAPSDNSQYARKNGTWAMVSGGSTSFPSSGLIKITCDAVAGGFVTVEKVYESSNKKTYLGTASDGIRWVLALDGGWFFYYLSAGASFTPSNATSPPGWPSVVKAQSSNASIPAAQATWQRVNYDSNGTLVSNSGSITVVDFVYTTASGTFASDGASTLAARADHIHPAPPASLISGLGTSSVKNVPATGDASSTQVVLGSDSRLSDARTPTTHSHPLSQIAQSGATTGQVPKWNGTAWIPDTMSSGTGVKQVAIPSDADRFSLTSTQVNLGDIVHVYVAPVLWVSPVYLISFSDAVDDTQPAYLYNGDNNYGPTYSDMGVSVGDTGNVVASKVSNYVASNFSSWIASSISGNSVTFSFVGEGSDFASVSFANSSITQTVYEVRSVPGISGTYYEVADISKLGTAEAFAVIPINNAFPSLALGSATIGSATIGSATIDFFGNVTATSQILNGDAGSDSILKVGALEFQPYGVNNVWFGDNAYYSGGFKFRNNGSAGLFYFQGANAGGSGEEGQFRMTASGTAGASFSPTTQLKISYTGEFGVGPAISPSTGNFGGSVFYVDGNGNARLSKSLKLSPTSAPSSPSAGQIYYDSTSNHLFVYNGSTWKQLDN